MRDLVYSLGDKKPVLKGDKYFIADTARVVGDVTLGNNVSVWFSAVIRGDMNKIEIGDNVSVQDCVSVHVGTEYPTKIGNDVTIGHNAIVHGCEVGNNVIIGMGATILNGTKVPDNCIIGANSLVGPKLHIEEGDLVVGNPARVVRKLSGENKAYITHAVEEYVSYIDVYNTEYKKEQIDEK